MLSVSKVTKCLQIWCHVCPHMQATHRRHRCASILVKIKISTHHTSDCQHLFKNSFCLQHITKTTNSASQILVITLQDETLQTLLEAIYTLFTGDWWPTGWLEGGLWSLTTLSMRSWDEHPSSSSQSIAMLIVRSVMTVSCCPASDSRHFSPWTLLLLYR